jgi:hypothetical protein
MIELHDGQCCSRRGTPILDERKSLPKATEGCPVLSSSLHRIFKIDALIVSVVKDAKSPRSFSDFTQWSSLKLLVVHSSLTR